MILETYPAYLESLEAEARAAMHGRVFGLREWMQHYFADSKPTFSGQLPPFPWSQRVLEQPCPFNRGKTISETHFAYLGLPSVDDVPITIHWLNRKKRCFCGVTASWCSRLPALTKRTCSLRWYLAPMPHLIVYSNIPFAIQQASLHQDYEGCWAIEEVCRNKFWQTLFDSPPAAYESRVCAEFVHHDQYHLSVSTDRDNHQIVHFSTVARHQTHPEISMAITRRVTS